MEEPVSEVLECAVCLESCNHPTQLPCGHVFCFLCAKINETLKKVHWCGHMRRDVDHMIKTGINIEEKRRGCERPKITSSGVAIQNKRCAMCRQEIPPDYLDHPVLIEGQPPPNQSALADLQAQWYYEGRNGWWKYDERSNSELEAAHAAGAAECRLLLAGALYHVDFRTLLQYRRNDATRRRRVKRDTPAAPAKGIAGIKISVESERAKSPEREVRGAAEDAPVASGGMEAPTPEHIIPPPHPFSIASALRSLSLDDATEPDPPAADGEQSE